MEAPPAHLKEAAYAARFMSNVDAELAALVFDSLNDAGPAMRRGSENQTRLLSFSNEFLTLDASLAADGCTIVGEIYPTVARVLHFEGRGDEPIAVEVDEFGRFRIVSDATSFRVRAAGHLVTPWIDRQ